MRKLRSEKKVHVKSKNEMRAFWNELKLAPRQILLLRGEVGSGKTQSVIWLAERFGAHDAASPSFALHNIYAIGGDQPVIDHFDLYRLRDDEDLESTGFWDVFEKNEGLILIEWSDRLNISELPLQWAVLEVTIQRVPNYGEMAEARELILREYSP